MFDRVGPWLAVASVALGLVVADAASGATIASAVAAVPCAGRVTIEYGCRYSFMLYAALFWVAAGGIVGAIVTLRLRRAQIEAR